MNHSPYPQPTYHTFPGRTIHVQPTRCVNHRRRRWPSRILFFTIGLLAGWVLRGGGAWLP